VATYVRDIARQVLNRVALEGGYELAGQYIGDRYQELVSQAKFRHLRKYGQIYLPAPITTGTVTITADSPLVYADNVALGAWQLQASSFYQYPDGFQGLFFRPQIGRTWYRIAQVEGAILTLETPFAEDNSEVFAGGNIVNAAYYILPRYINLADDARQLGIFACDFMYRPLRIVSEDQLNLVASNRFWVWAYPQMVAEVNMNLGTTGQPKVVEIYPWPVQSVTMHYTYWSTPQVLALDDAIPPVIDPDILRTGALIDACLNAGANAARKGNLELAAYYTNLSNQQKTEWNAKVPRAIRNDRGIDDLKFIASYGWRRAAPVDFDPVQTAYQNFLARGY
jgi:hypothetical protein